MASLHRVRAGLASGLLLATAAVLEPIDATACSGGMRLDWAVHHAREGIATATLVETRERAAGFHEVRLIDVTPVRGTAPATGWIEVVLGAPCDQVLEAGQRLLLLDGITGDHGSYDVPVAYVVRGSDALDPIDVRLAFAGLPATDAGARPAVGGNGARPTVAPLLAAAGLAGLWLALRRSPTRRRSRGP